MHFDLQQTQKNPAHGKPRWWIVCKHRDNHVHSMGDIVVQACATNCNTYAFLSLSSLFYFPPLPLGWLSFSNLVSESESYVRLVGSGLHTIHHLPAHSYLYFTSSPRHCVLRTVGIFFSHSSGVLNKYIMLAHSHNLGKPDFRLLFNSDSLSFSFQRLSCETEQSKSWHKPVAAVHELCPKD
jgi:hypothetical protein